jgi:hypothetical protein
MDDFLDIKHGEMMPIEELDDKDLGDQHYLAYEDKLR